MVNSVVFRVVLRYDSVLLGTQDDGVEESRHHLPPADHLGFGAVGLEPKVPHQAARGK